MRVGNHDDRPRRLPLLPACRQQCTNGRCWGCQGFEWQLLKCPVVASNGEPFCNVNTLGVGGQPWRGAGWANQWPLALFCHTHTPQAPLASLPQRSINLFAGLNIAQDLLKAKFCTPAKFSPPRPQGHVFFGPGLSIQITTGSVIINETELLLNKAPAYNKTLPAVNIVATPAEFVSKTSGRPSVVSNFCRFQRSFGNQTTRVLAVFDGNTTSTGKGLDRQAVITTVITEVTRLQRPDVVEEQLIIGFLRANKLLVPFARLVPANNNTTASTPSPGPAPSTRSPALPASQFSTFERLAPSLSF